VTRAELILNLTRVYPNLPKHVISALVVRMFDVISDELVEGKRVEVRGFGAFFVRQRAPRVARNPKTGAKVSVGARKVLAFRPGKRLKEWVNTPS
jgi:integration host factor subunit beta